MRLVDLNILLYATNADSPRHEAAAEWLEGTIGGGDSLALSWVVVLDFLRLTTSARVFTQALSTQDAIAVVHRWLAQPNVVLIQPGPWHWSTLRALLTGAGAHGNLTTDAHLAALAIEHGCELCWTDADFARLPLLNWRNPL